MKNVVMGTAGHIDHGKTSLVKRLTGIDTDRLEEEKRRGMTIELGFAPFTLPSGNTISIIDVPGHEKFVKTMVAGVTGIDFVTLVIAADEGVMPQTREHIDILSLLNISSGVVALTKTDLVDEEWIDLVKEDIDKALSGTTLEGAPIIPVSSATGYGIDKLIQYMETMIEQADEKDVQELFRLPVDRVFTISGHGTVITGTIAGGKVFKGDTVEILPSGLRTRVRGIQVHNLNVESAGAGERCALNLAGVEKEAIGRGNVAVSQGLISPTRMVDVVLNTINECAGVKHNQRVHVHIGTQEVVARVRVLGADEIPGGEKGYVQLRFEAPVVALRGDRFIVRAYSPVTTLGGGWILFHTPPNRARFLSESIEAMTTGELGSPREIVHLIMKSSEKILRQEEVWLETFINKDKLQNILEDEVESGRTIYLKETNKYLSRETYKLYIKRLNLEFMKFYRKYPFRYKIDKEEIKSRVFSSLDLKDFTALLSRFVEDGSFILDSNFLMQPDNSVIDKIFAMKETGLVERELLKDGMNARSIQQLCQDLMVEQDKIGEIQRFLLQAGRITDLNGGLFIHNDVLKPSIAKIRALLNEKGSTNAAEIRDCLSVGRKTAIALAEYLDSIGITERVGDIRKPGIHYMDYFI